MLQEILFKFNTLTRIFLIISIGIISIRYRRIPLIIKLLGLYLVVNLCTEFYARWLTNRKINNLFLLHIYTLLEFLTWSLFYKYLFKKSVKDWFQKYFWVIISFISILIILNSTFLEPTTGFNSNAKTLVQIILIGYAIAYFFRSFGKIDFSETINQSIILINFAVLLYYSGSLFIFMFTNCIYNTMLLL